MKTINNLTYLRLLELNLTNFKPWRILTQKKSDDYSIQIKNRYPKRKLIPFAVRCDCDDVACWDLSRESDKIYIIHDFASDGFENIQEYENFEEWLKIALKNMIEFQD